MDPSQRRRKNNFLGKSGQRHEKNKQNRTLFLSEERKVLYICTSYTYSMQQRTSKYELFLSVSRHGELF